MDPRLVEELGEGVFAVAIEPIKRLRRMRYPVLGFDTEYDSKTHALVSFQLANDDRRAFVACKRMTVDSLARAVRGFVAPETEAVLLVAFFSIAELQHLPVIEQALEIKSFGSSIDVVFYSRRYGLLLHVFDLSRFWQSPRKSLAQVAESYGFAKMRFDTKRVTRKSANSARFREYAIHDAVLCYDIAAQLRAGFEPDDVDPLFEGSAASTAAAAFRIKLGRTLHPPASRTRLFGLLCCWGGRAEALERGSFKQLFEFDLVSAYPNAAISLGQFPGKGDWRKVKHVRDFRGAVGGLGRVRFRFPGGATYPCLPVWTRKLQIYPLEGESYCTLDEIRLALEMGADVRVVEAYAYWKGCTELPDFMRRIVAERSATKDPVRRTALKLLANSLIGKLAQRVTGPDMNDLVEHARRKSLTLGQFARLTREECIALGIKLHVRLGSLFFPEWNSLITGRTRAILGAAIAERRAAYASTDAIWIRAKQAPTAILGARWDYVRGGRAVIARTRLARLGEHVAHHSIWRKDAGEEVLEHLAEESDEPVSYTVERPLKLRESLNKGERYGKWVKEERTAAGDWDCKRELTPSGSRPWRSAAAYLEAQADLAQARRAASRRARGGGDS